MNEHLGIFLNNTVSNMKYKINLNNFIKLSNDFDGFIIIDINNDFSKNLQKDIKKILFKKKNNSVEDIEDSEIDLIKYFLNDTLIEYFLDDTLYCQNDLDIVKIKMIIKKITHLKFKYITFIHDKYIYTGSIKEYLKYISNHNLEFSSFLDSSYYTYHYETFIFSIEHTKLNLINDIINNDMFNISTIHTRFNSSMPYLKIAYSYNNNYTNIFDNDDLYKLLFKNGKLPVISIDKLLFLINIYNYEYFIFNEIPENFDIDIYKKNVPELYESSEYVLKQNFLNQGQFLYKNYSKYNNYINYILPEYIRISLEEEGLLNFFDVPSHFNVHKYKEHNADLSNLNERDLIIHWVNYGCNENRICS